MDRIKKIRLGKHNFMKTSIKHGPHKNSPEKASIVKGQKIALTYGDKKGPIFYIRVDDIFEESDTYTGTIYEFPNDQKDYGDLKLGDTIQFCEDNVLNFQ